jgi:hypothetical protein
MSVTFVAYTAETREAVRAEKVRRARLAIVCDVDPDMILPDGETCSTCRSFGRCVALLGESNCRPDNVYCDWSPCRWRPIPHPQSLIPSPAP